MRLLSDGRCSLVGGYALTTDSLVKPGMKTARLPDFAGATRDDRRRRVALGVLVPSQPYVYSPMTVVLGPKAQGRKIGDIGDLAGLRLAIESGSLGDAILMTFDKGRLIDSITHLVPGRDDLLGALQRGDYDATLIDLGRFDAHRAAHPDTTITASGYYYPIGANRGYVGLASDRRTDRRGQQGADQPCCRGQDRRIRQAGRPHLSAAARACDPRRCLDEDHSEVRCSRPSRCAHAAGFAGLRSGRRA